MMSSWKVSLGVGFVLGSILASAVWNRNPGPSQEEYELLLHKNAVLAEKQQVLQESFEELETQKALELEKAFEQLTGKQAELEQQKADYEEQLAQLKQQQKKLVVTKKKLDTKVVELETATEKQQVVLSHSKELYQQQLLLQKQVAKAEADVKKAKRVAEDFKKPCDEFKSGTSWNWVSQADCDKYDAKIKAVADEEAQLTALKTELEALNQKIEVNLPKK
ncbi:chromosome segregation ATPase [Photobacterium alginatilyticum]|uniref:Chromosome segregation ATPase n=1 Tax=Photobacterium alginatilyticum TaxID=1775171 RepID=A0ABW9YJ24_9GAMM|nr:chromosome segregation ATPase [Photobacterium alginatilyticum]NBI53089.1 chromosome segregation ATPase [Photobacterium alginatilyticum]